MGSANTNPIFPSKIRTLVRNFYPNQTVVGQDNFVFAAGEQGSRVDRLCASSTATESIAYELYLRGAEITTDVFPVAFGVIPAGSGHTVPIHNMMPADLADSEGRIFISGPYDAAQFRGMLLIKFLNPIPADADVTTLIMANDY